MRSKNQFHQQIEALSFLLVFAAIGGCSVWKADHSSATYYDKDGSYDVDETRMRDGQPYFLPKGMVRLTIKPGQAMDKEAKKDDTGNVPLPAGQGTGSGLGLDGNQKTYNVTVGVQFEPDSSAGTYYAHYSPNWFFNDQVSVKADGKGLLETVTAVTKDETKAIVDNLTDTVTNIMQASAQFAIAGGKKVSDTSAGPPPKSLPMKVIKVKELNIDETFDPLNPADRARIESLFTDAEGERYTVLSPFKIDIHPRTTKAGQHLQPVKIERQGLWFREPQEVEIVLKPNPLVFARTKQALTDICRLVEAKEHEYKVQKAKEDEEERKERERQRTIARAKAAEDEKKKKDSSKGGQPPSPNPVNNILNAAAEGDAAAIPATGEPKEPSRAVALGVELTALQAKKTEMENLYFKSQPGSSASLGSFTVLVANKERPFALDIKRSAFVSRTTTVGISKGMLMSIGHNKPSEILGFSEIPLSVTGKILALPKKMIEGNTAVQKAKNDFEAMQSKAGN